MWGWRYVLRDCKRNRGGIPPEQDGIPPQQDGSPSQQDGILPQQDGIPPQQDGIPPQQDGSVTHHGRTRDHLSLSQVNNISIPAELRVFFLTIEILNETLYFTA